MEPLKTTKLDGMTPHYHPYILCNFANYAHTINFTLYMHFGLFIPTKSMDNYIPTRHSALLTPHLSAYKTTHMSHVQQTFTT